MPTQFRFAPAEKSRLHIHIGACADLRLPVVARGELAHVPGVAVAAPSPGLLTLANLQRLRERVAAGWQVWGLKEALTLLRDRGIEVAASVNMDPGAGEAKRTPSLGGVTYYVASSCHPELFAHLRRDMREIRVFHSATGWTGDLVTPPGFPGSGRPIKLDERMLYAAMFPRADILQTGYTVANRALALARYLGVARVEMFGVMFGYRPGSSYLAGGRATGAGKRPKLGRNEITVDLPINGKTRWITKPDALASALDMMLAMRAGDVVVHPPSLVLDLAKLSEAQLCRAFPAYRNHERLPDVAEGHRRVA